MESFRPRSVRPRGRVASVGWLLPACVCLLAAGCNSGKQLHRDLVQRELRLQEDEIYRLEDYLEEYQRKVCELRKENQDLKQQIAGGGGSAPIDAPEALSGEHSLLDLPEDFAPEPPNGSPEDADQRFVPPEVPKFEFGTPADPPITPVEESGPPPIDLPGGDEPPPFRPGLPPVEPLETAPPPLPEEITAPKPTLEPLSFEADLERLKPIEELLDDRTSAIERLAITGRPGTPEPNGQATLLVSVTPQSADGAAAAFDGEAAIMLRSPGDARDPSISGATLARWDFTADEVLDTMTDQLEGKATEFLVGLPVGTPTDGPLELWVRLVDRQGNKTLGVTPIQIAHPTAEAPIELAPIVAQRAETPSIPKPSEPANAVQPASWSAPMLPPSLPPLTPPSAVPRTTVSQPAETHLRWRGAKQPQGAQQPEPAGTTLRIAPTEPAPARPPAPANPWHETGRDALAPRPADLGFSFEP